MPAMQPETVHALQLCAAVFLGWNVALLGAMRVWRSLHPGPEPLTVPTIANCRKSSTLLYLAAQEMAEAERQLVLHLRGQARETALDDVQTRIRNACTDLRSAEDILRR